MTHHIILTSFTGASASAVAHGVAASTRSVMVSQKPIVDQAGGWRANVNGRRYGGGIGVAVGRGEDIQFLNSRLT